MHRKGRRRHCRSLAIIAAAIASTSTAGFAANNTSVLTLVGNGSDGKTNDSTTFDYGRVLAGQPITTQSFSLTNSSTTPDDTLSYRVVQSSSPLSASVVNTNFDPLNPGQNATITVGFSSANTLRSAGFDIFGTVSYQNISNRNDANVVINAMAHGVANRAVSTATSTSPNVGEILVGSTMIGSASAPEGVETLFTTNPVGDILNNFDYTTNGLTAQTLISNSVTPILNVYEQFASGINTTVANISAFAPSFNQTFTNSGTGVVYFQVQALHSGSYGTFNNGSTNSFAVGSRTIAIGPQFVTFPQADVIGEGLAGETDTMTSYAQWTAWQAASITSNYSSILGPGGSANLTNAVPNDATFTQGTSTMNYGLRAAGRITAIIFNQNGWNQSGFAEGAQGIGTVIPDSGSATTAAIGQDTSNLLNGTYNGTLTITMESDDQYNASTGTGIFGTSHNDIAPVTYNLQSVVSTANGTGAAGTSGTYSLTGGTFVSASGLTLNNNFNQTGGTATFVNISGNGSISVSGPGTSLALSAPTLSGSSLSVGNGSLVTISHSIAGDSMLRVNALTLAGSATLDITNNTLVINYTGSSSPDTLIRNAIKNGFHGGDWSGTGITSSTAAQDASSGTPFGGNSAIGYADNALLGRGDIPNSSELVRFTFYGDTDLNGVVNGDDFSNFLAGFADPTDNPPNWVDGDFDYSGTVNGDDFSLFLNAFQANLGVLSSLEHQIEVSTLTPSQQQTLLNSTAAVPEPASIGLVAIAPFCLLFRRKRKLIPISPD